MAITEEKVGQMQLKLNLTCIRYYYRTVMHMKSTSLSILLKDDEEIAVLDTTQHFSKVAINSVKVSKYSDRSQT